MPRVVAIREAILQSGVTAADFERYVTDELNPALRGLPAGVVFSVLKGERGDRVGGYLFLCEFDSLETRNRYFPSEESASAEWQSFDQALSAALEKWSTLASSVDLFTDYVALGR
jgi:hypothetical protein